MPWADQRASVRGCLPNRSAATRARISSGLLGCVILLSIDQEFESLDWELGMSHPTKQQALVKAARRGQPVQRVEIPRVSCPRCQQEGIYALPDGSPRARTCARPSRETRAGQRSFQPR
jgi:hypothetical protein